MSGAGAPVALDVATDLEEEDGRYSIRLDEAWEIWGPSGGYLASLALRAAGKSAEIQRPASLYCHFLSSPAFDRVELEVDVVKRGRRSESLAVRMTQDERVVLFAMVLTASEAPGYRHQEVSAPDVAAPDASKPFERTRDGKPLFPFWSNMSCRRPEGGGVEGAERSLIREWVRFEPTPSFENPFVDAARPLILLDTFGWPALYERYRGADYVAPNLDTSVWFHQFTTESEWLLIDHECPVAEGGLLGVSGRIWSPDGRLLASGNAQLCCIPKERNG
jgi:acyl-CoA thioesterase II